MGFVSIYIDIGSIHLRLFWRSILWCCQ